MIRIVGKILGFSVAIILLNACEGPMGPDGTEGKDANETCKKCHNNESGLSSKFAQANHSMHLSGEAWFEGTRNSCAPCHTKDGFLDVIKNNPANNKYFASAGVLNTPSPLGCGTCHKIHTVYDSTDWDLTFSGSINLLIDTTKNIAVNLNNKSQLCMKCHQPRIVKQMDFTNTPNGTYTGISYRWGPHYGTVGAIFAGKGAFEISGNMGYANSSHTTVSSCVTCHMATQSGLSGGHTFFAKNEENGSINTNGCAVCHQSEITAKTFTGKITAAQDTIKKYLTQLSDKIDALGTNGGILEKDGEGNYTGYVDIYDASSNPDANYKNPGNGNIAFPTINNKQAAAIVNLQLIVRDKSLGIHNFLYTKALLKNSIAAL
jgi:hypothetical protein